MLPSPASRGGAKWQMAKKKVAANPKAVGARERKEARTAVATAASASAAEDAYWEAAGEGSKSKAAAKREEQVSWSECGGKTR